MIAARNEQHCSRALAPSSHLAHLHTSATARAQTSLSLEDDRWSSIRELSVDTDTDQFGQLLYVLDPMLLTDVNAHWLSEGGHLAPVAFYVDQSVLMAYVSTRGCGAEPFWIDGSELQDEGVFLRSNGSLLCYTNWTVSSSGNDGDACLEIRVAGEEWSDADHGTTLPFVCYVCKRGESVYFPERWVAARTRSSPTS